MPQKVLIHILQSQRATIAEAVLIDPDVEAHQDPVRLRTVGEALRHPEDKNDPELGEALAIGRALTSMGKKLTKRANGLVRMHEHNNAKSEEARRIRKNHHPEVVSHSVTSPTVRRRRLFSNPSTR